MSKNTNNLTDTQIGLCSDIMEKVRYAYAYPMTASDLFDAIGALREVLSAVTAEACERLAEESGDTPVNKYLFNLRVLAIGGGIDVPKGIEIPKDEVALDTFRQFFARKYSGWGAEALETEKDLLVKKLKEALEQTEMVKVLKELEK